MAMPTDLERLQRDLAAFGLRLRGGALVEAGRTLLLVGNAGGELWPHFERWKGRRGGGDNPLDSWTREAVDTVAARHGAAAIYPFDLPYPPFQRWAMAAEGLRSSPLGILIHPEFGLWHAYRAALVFDGAATLPRRETAVHPCDQCSEKPCLDACPVRAFTVDGFAEKRCRNYLDSDASSPIDAGEPNPCVAEGCAARNACPIGRHWRYGREQRQFHMRAFARRPGHNPAQSQS